MKRSILLIWDRLRKVSPEFAILFVFLVIVVSWTLVSKYLPPREIGLSSAKADNIVESASHPPSAQVASTTSAANTPTATAQNAATNPKLSTPAICPAGTENYYLTYSTQQGMDAEFLCANPAAFQTANGILEINKYLSDKVGARAVMIEFHSAR